eukprot:Transcript_14599.p1 GENE.Transcript_14599~~Transcript_14599.p1  ORF type:complete len:579 (+),score=178.30 Transcript_14599:595-2331(+)
MQSNKRPRTEAEVLRDQRLARERKRAKEEEYKVARNQYLAQREKQERKEKEEERKRAWEAQAPARERRAAEERKQQQQKEERRKEKLRSEHEERLIAVAEREEKEDSYRRRAHRHPSKMLLRCCNALLNLRCDDLRYMYDLSDDLRLTFTFEIMTTALNNGADPNYLGRIKDAEEGTACYGGASSTPLGCALHYLEPWLKHEMQTRKEAMTGINYASPIIVHDPHKRWVGLRDDEESAALYTLEEIKDMVELLAKHGARAWVCPGSSTSTQRVRELVRSNIERVWPVYSALVRYGIDNPAGAHQEVIFAPATREQPFTGLTPLHVAIKLADFEAVKYLIANRGKCQVNFFTRGVSNDDPVFDPQRFEVDEEEMVDDIGAVVLGGGDKPWEPGRLTPLELALALYEHPIVQLSASMVGHKVASAHALQVAALPRIRALMRWLTRARVAAIEGVFKRYLVVACNEVMYRPGGRGAQRSRDSFEAGAAEQARLRAEYYVQQAIAAEYNEMTAAWADYEDSYAEYAPPPVPLDSPLRLSDKARGKLKSPLSSPPAAEEEARREAAAMAAADAEAEPVLAAAQ